MKRISMWSGPRNVSTAIMYSFHHRGDCEVIDEPFYAHYLTKTGIDHPGRQETLASQEHDSSKVVSRLTRSSSDKPILFMKNMPHHMIDVDMDFVSSFQNFFLIREPRSMIASYIKKIPDVKMTDLGLDRQFQLFEDLRAQGGSPPVVDSYTLLKHPETVLSSLCESLEIPFSHDMLHWEAGPITADGAWAKYWYANVHASTGLGKPKEPGLSVIPSHLEVLVKECEAYYHELKKYELRP